MATKEELLLQLDVVQGHHVLLEKELEDIRAVINGEEPPPPSDGLQHPVPVGTGNLWFRRSRTLNISGVTVTAQTPPDPTTNLWRYDIEWADGTANNIAQGRLGRTEEEVNLPDA